MELPGAQGRPIPLVDRGVGARQGVVCVRTAASAVRVSCYLAQKLCRAAAVSRPDRSRSAPANDSRSLAYESSGRLDPRRGMVLLRSKNRDRRRARPGAPVADGEAKITATAKGIIVDRHRPREGFPRPVHLELPQSRHPRDDQDGLQSGRLPRRAGREKRIQAHPARLRSRRRLRHPDPQLRRPPRLPGRSRRKPDRRQALVRHPPRRRQALRQGFARIPRDRRMDRRRRPRSLRQRLQIRGLEVFPAAAVLAPEAEQQIVVRAKYSDGHSEDVTRWVKFSSSNEGVATVDDWGHVKMNGSGEAAITLWYSSRVLYSRLSVPFPNEISAATLRPISAPQFHRRPGRRQVEEPPPRPLEARRRCRIPPPRLPRFHRHPPHLRRRREFPSRPVTRQARQADRPPAPARRVRRLLGLQMVRPAAGLQPPPELHCHVGLLRLDPRFASSRTSPGTNSLAIFSSAPAAPARTARSIISSCTKTPSS